MPLTNPKNLKNRRVALYSPRMSLAPGTRLGPNEIITAIGAGGMGARGLRKARSRRAHASRGWGPAPLLKEDA